ncbi:MAG: hypothetical protein B7733_03265, partial [Myxococcales bacterium FL481]
MSRDRRSVLTVGAANVERVIVCGRLSPGDKHLVAPGVETAGGSALNHSCRLLAAGFSALPLVPLGDDVAGDTVRRVVFDAVRARDECGGGNLTSWFDRLARRGATTSVTTVVVEADGRRTVLTERGSASDSYPAVAADVLDELSPSEISGVLIGHIHSDRASAQNAGGRTTSRVIDRFVDDVPVVANLGRTQYRLGPERWLDELRRVDLFQLSLLEAREFCGIARPSVRVIARWFQERGINALITVDRFGALGVLRDCRDVVFAWPDDLGDAVRDTTGAGDAMAAALMAEMVATGVRGRDFRPSDLAS